MKRVIAFCVGDAVVGILVGLGVGFEVFLLGVGGLGIGVLDPVGLVVGAKVSWLVGW